MRAFSFLLPIAISFCWVSPLSAEEPPFLWGHAWDVGAKAQGLGGAYTAIADDYTALHHNPAGLGQIDATLIGCDFSYLSLTNASRYAGIHQTETDGFTRLEAVGIALPVPTVRGSLVFALGYHRVRQFDQSFTGSLQVVEPGYQATWEPIRNEEGGLSNTSLGCAVEMAPGLFVGGSVNIWGGEDDYTWQFTEKDAYYGGTWVADSTATDHVVSRFSGVNMTLGSLFRVSPHVRMGVCLETPVTLKVKETWEYSEVFTWHDGTSETAAYEEGRFEYKVRHPWRFRAGAAVERGPLLLTADAALKNVSEIRYQSDPPWGGTAGEANLQIKRTLKSGWDYGGGAQVRLPFAPLSCFGGVTRLHDASRSGKNRILFSGGLELSVNPNATIRVTYAQTTATSTLFDPPSGLTINQDFTLGKTFFSILYRF